MDGISYLDVTSVSVCHCSACAKLLNSNGTLAQAAMGSSDNVHASTRGAELLTQTRNADGSWSFSGDRNVDAVLIGSRWTGSTLTYTFPTNGDYSNEPQTTGQIEFNDAQKAAARAGFALVESFTGLVITEVPPGTKDTTFHLSQAASPFVPSAQGYFPNWSLDGQGGDIWFGRSGQPFYENPAKGNWGWATMLHEIGHTLGLKHGMDDYTNEDLGEFLGATGPFYGTRALEYDKNGQAWSLMTYTAAPNGDVGFQGDQANQPQSYMQIDMAALQYLYGANFTSNAGDTVYRWDPLTGEKSINGVAQGAAPGGKVFETLWDGGGNDTYDFSAYAGGVRVDLRPGAFTTFSTEKLANSNAYSGGEALAPGNIANALLYQDNLASLIENAIGGAGGDTLIGNQVNNVLNGQGGDDLLVGGLGSDRLIGGAGNDIADFTDALSGITVTLNGGAADILVANGDDVDVLSGIEGVIGTAFDDRLTGDAGANTLGGGAGGDDVLLGGAGNDVLIGGGYTLAYRDEPDVVRAAAAPNRSMADAIVLDGSFDLAARAGIYTAGVYGDAVLPHATVVAEPGETSGRDYYRITATAGARALFDIDLTNDFTGIEILNAAGEIVASNYGVLTSDDGSARGYDARLAHVFAADGDYYIRVTSDAGGNLSPGQRYTLHVSLERAAVDAPDLRATATLVAEGGAGDDLIVATAGDDRIDGGSGTDTLSYANHYRGVTVDLNVTEAQATGAGTDRITGIENLRGSIHDDRLTGTVGDNVIDGGGGSDVLDGGAGVDILSFASQTRGVTVDLGKQGVAQDMRPGERLVATGFEHITGGSGDDVLTGDGAANIVRGGLGDDVLNGGVPGVAGAVDQLFGGEGSDTASFAGFTSGVVATLGRGGQSGTATQSGNRIAVLYDIENLSGGAGADRLIGNEQDNRLSGGAGNDFLDGGAGIDTADYSGNVAVTVDLANTGAQNTGHGRDTLRRIENVRGGSGDDRLSGNAGDNVFYDAGGNDRYDGRGGADTVDYSTATASVYIDLALTGAQATGGGGSDTLIAVENLVGSQDDSYLFGNDGDNVLTGNGADDVLTGRLGNDTLIGGDGDDLLSGDGFSVDPGADPTQMRDVLYGGAGRDILLGGAGDDILDGGDGDDLLSNGTFNSEIYPDGALVNDVIRADGGDDIIDGGAGDDYGLLVYSGRTAAVSLDMRDTQALNVIYSDGIAAGSITRIERLEYYAGDGGDTVYGAEGYDSFYDGAGDDRFSGGLGDDRMFYSAGNDRMDGGAGFDRISFAEAKSGVTIDLLRTDVQAVGSMGTLQISGFEDARSSAFGDTMYLTDWDNRIEDDGVGNDSFFGRGGNDSIVILRNRGDATTNWIDGGDGNDYLAYYGNRFVDGAKNPLDSVVISGGAGDDYIVIVDPRSGFVSAGDGNDSIYASMTGSDDNSLSISLGAGADELIVGNVDAATFTVNRTRVTVSDFSVAEDVLDLSLLVERWVVPTITIGQDPFRTGHIRLVQSGTSTLVQADRDGWDSASAPVTVLTLENVTASSLTGANFFIMPFPLVTPITVDPGATLLPLIEGGAGDDVLTGTGVSERLIGLAGDDRLYGMGGDDVLAGGIGNDLLGGGTGSDYLLGGAGNDTLLGEAGDDVLYGEAGDDRLDGGIGGDRMEGGAGDDSYVVDNTADQVIEAANAGSDTVYAAIDYVLGADVEHLVLTGDARTGTGNALANRLTGSAGNDMLYGLDGMDLLRGGAGADRLDGGAGGDWLDGGAGGDTLVGGAGGSDIFFFGTDNAGSRDTILDFGAGDLLVTSVQIRDGNNDGIIDFGRNKVLDLGGAGSVVIRDEAGVGMTRLYYNGSYSADGTDYYIYSMSKTANPALDARLSDYGLD